MTPNNAGTELSMVQRLVIIGVFYTPPNLALLCCLSALLGALGRAGLSSARDMQTHVDAAVPLAGDQSNPDRLIVSMTSVTVRGFCVYLIVISGLLLLTGEPFGEPTPEQYIRLAGTSSLFAFMAGYSPDLFVRLLSRLGMATTDT